MVMSRTDGAPTLPIQSDEEAALMELDHLYANNQIDVETYWVRKAAIQARRQGLPTTEATVDEQLRQNGADYRDSGLMPRPSPPPSSVEGMPGPMSMMQQDGRDMQNAQDYGRRVGGGAAFTSEDEAQQYNQRTNLSEEQKAAMRAAGASEGEIIDMERSQFDRDMAQVGITGGTGWVPVYGPNGTVTYMERAPASGEDIMGATDKAVGGARRVGPSVDNRDVSPSLQRKDLEARGYEARPVEGPYGTEWVYRAQYISADMERRLREDYGFTDEQINEFKNGAGDDTTSYQLATRAMADQRQREGMAAKAGLTQAEGRGKSRMELRQLIRDNREAQLAQRKEVARRARMASRPRNELGLQQLSDPNLSDWEKAALFAQITDDIDNVQNLTPLGVEAQSMQNAWRLAQAALEGGGANAAEMARQRERQQAARVVARGAANASGWWGETTPEARRQRAEKALRDDPAGFDEDEIEAALSEFPLTAPAPEEDPASEEAEPPARKPGKRVPPRQGGGRGKPPTKPFRMPESGGGRGMGGSRPGKPRQDWR